MTSPTPEKMQAQALEYVKQGQEALATMTTTISETLSSMVRSVGGQTPGAAGAMPRPADAIDQAFDFSIQVLEMQRAFAHSLLDAAAPAVRAAESAVDPAADRARTR